MTSAGTQPFVDVGTPGTARAQARDLAPVALVDLLDRLLGSGVVVAGDVVVSLAGVDLVEIKLQLLISSVRAEMADPGGQPP